MTSDCMCVFSSVRDLNIDSEGSTKKSDSVCGLKPDRFSPYSTGPAIDCGKRLAMEGLLNEHRPFDREDTDMSYLFDPDAFHDSTPFPDEFDSNLSSSSEWFSNLFEDPLLSDRIPPGSLSPNPHIQSEHSYSMMNEPCSPLMKNIKMEDFEEDNLELPLLDDNEISQPIDVKSELNEVDVCNCPLSPEPTDMTSTDLTSAFPVALRIASSQSTGTATTIPRTTTTTTTFLMRKEIPLKIKLEPITMDTDHITHDMLSNGYDRLQLPPTPPSSTTSDSEGSLSPHRMVSEPSSPQPIPLSPIRKPEMQTTRIITQPIFTNTQRLPQSGPLTLSEEERRTLIQEGYHIPTKLPLTKAEEKSLKKVRRKIKNKISAQESRRKKKEYVEALERKMDSYTHENSSLRKKVDSLENTNQSLMSQLHKLQNIVNKVSKPIKASATQTGTCMMVLVLCFAVFLGAWTPQSFLNNTNLSAMPSNAPSTPNEIFAPINHVYYGPQLDEEEVSDKGRVLYGPLPLDETNDAYTTPNLRSSRMLMSFDDDDDLPFSENFPYMRRMNNLDMSIPSSKYDYSKPCLDKRVPAVQPSKPLGPAVEPGSEVISEAMTQEMQAIMHPDIEAQLIAMDTITRLNGSKNK